MVHVHHSRYSIPCQWYSSTHRSYGGTCSIWYHGCTCKCTPSSVCFIATIWYTMVHVYHGTNGIAITRYHGTRAALECTASGPWTSDLGPCRTHGTRTAHARYTCTMVQGAADADTRNRFVRTRAAHVAVTRIQSRLVQISQNALGPLVVSCDGALARFAMSGSFARSEVQTRRRVQARGQQRRW